MQNRGDFRINIYFKTLLLAVTAGLFFINSAFITNASVSGLTATAVSSSQINLSWSGSSTSFWIWRNSGWLTGVGSAKSYSNSGLSPNTTYSYIILDNNTGAWSNWASATTPAPSCSEGYKCVSSTNLDYQYSNCNWWLGGSGYNCRDYGLVGCSGSSCVCAGNLGAACNRNACGGTGTIQCNGSCSAAAPPVYGTARCGICSSGITNNCTGSCFGALGSFPYTLGAACNNNACGGGTITNACSGSCSISSPPTVPGNLGAACGTCNNGTINCSGNCVGASTPSNYNAACGTCGNGRIDCNGNCSGGWANYSVGYCGFNGCFYGFNNQCTNVCDSPAPAPAPGNLGAGCSSPANACGATTGGSITCSGSCSATAAPANPAGYGSGCTSSANSCGQTNSGTIGCNGCSASAPPNSGCPAPVLTAAAVSPTQINLSWTTSGGYYYIQRGGGFIWNGSANSYSNTGLSPNTSYSYNVLNYSTGKWSGWVSATTLPPPCAGNNNQSCSFISDPNACGQTQTGGGFYNCAGVCSGSKPAPPPNSGCPAPVLTAAAVSPTQINLSWTTSGGYYYIQRGGGFIWNGSANSYSNTGLSPNTSYSYNVLNYSTGKWSGWVSAATPAALDTTPPSVSGVYSPSSPTSSQTVNFTGNASDASGISSIYLYIDYSMVKACSNAISCSYTGGPYASSAHTFTIYARDNSSNYNPNSASYGFTAIASVSSLSGWAWIGADNCGASCPFDLGNPQTYSLGWISLNCSDQGTCGTSNYKVDIAVNGNLSGYAWSAATSTEGLGWISFNNSDVNNCPNYPPNSICQPKRNSTTGQVSGWARILSIKDDNNEGWISLRGNPSFPCPPPAPASAPVPLVPDDYGVCIANNGAVTGYAWSSDIGWIDFNYAGAGSISTITTGTINVTSNIAAPFGLSGGAPYSGTTPWTNNSVSVNNGSSDYKITWNNVAGYTAPATPPSKALTTNGTITFNGIYVKLPPSAPNLFFSCAATSTSVCVTWSNVGADYYSLVKYSPVFSVPYSGSKTNYTDNSLSANTVYSYKIVACNGSSCTEGNTISFTTPKDTGTISVTTTPVNGNITINGKPESSPYSGTVNPGVYTIIFGPVAGYTAPLPQTVTVATGVTTTVSGAGATYTLLPPSAPTLSYGSVTYNSALLSWTDLGSGVNYNLYNYNKSLTITVTPVAYTDISWTDSLSASTLYTFIVKACNAAGCTDSNIISFSTPAQPNSAPIVANLQLSVPNNTELCGIASDYNFQWDYNDSGAQSKFQLQIDNNSDFSSPTVDRTVTSPPAIGNPNFQSVLLTSSADSPGSNKLSYQGTVYYWRVMVWDNLNVDSGWVSGGASFTTPAHMYPTSDFIFTPSNPQINKNITFTDASEAFGGSLIIQRDWDFCDGLGSCPAGGKTASGTPVIKKYTSAQIYNVKLTVADSTPAAQGGPYICSVIKQVNTGAAVNPSWQEVIPE